MALPCDLQSHCLILLIVGLGLHLTYWPATFIDGLLQRGHRVIVFDNRDSGRSSRVSATPPGLLRQMTRRIEPSAYELADMAKDAIGLLNHLGIKKAHVAGMSMGGMIAQTVAALSPERVISLTSMFSTTGALNVGQPTPASLLMMAKAPPRSREHAIESFVQVMQRVGATRFSLDLQSMRAYAANAWDRGTGATAHEGIARQIGAILKSGDRTEQVKNIKAPTLVIHSDKDVLVAPSGGAATANAIQRSTLVTIPGLGHSVPASASNLLVDLIGGHAERALFGPGSAAAKSPSSDVRYA